MTNYNFHMLDQLDALEERLSVKDLLLMIPSSHIVHCSLGFNKFYLILKQNSSLFTVILYI